MKKNTKTPQAKKTSALTAEKKGNAKKHNEVEESVKPRRVKSFSRQ